MHPTHSAVLAAACGFHYLAYMPSPPDERDERLSVLVREALSCLRGRDAPICMPPSKAWGYMQMVGVFDLAEAEMSRQLCSQLLGERNTGGHTGSPHVVRPRRLLVLSAALLDHSHGVVTVRKERLGLYFWVTRLIPPEHLYAAYLAGLPYAEARPLRGGHAYSRRLQLAADELADSHVHLTGSQLTLHTRLMMGTPVYAARSPKLIKAVKRDSGIRAEDENTKNAIMLAVLQNMVRLTLHPGLTPAAKGRIRDATKRLLKGLGPKPSYTALRNTYRRLVGRASPRAKPWQLDPLLADPGDTLRAEHVLVEEALRAITGGTISWEELRLFNLYLAVSAALHRFLTHQPPYHSLEIFSKVYERNELPNASKPSRRPLRLLAAEVMKAASSVYAWRSATVYFKASAKRPRLLDHLVAAFTSGPARDVGLYLGFIKKPCSPQSPRCGNLFREAHRYMGGALRLLSNPRCCRHASGAVVGVDVAGAERLAPNWVYKPFVDALRGSAGRRLLVSVHAGEDYYHVSNGLRKVYEAAVLIGLGFQDSIGHALALVAEPRHGEAAGEPLDELLWDTVFLAHLAEERGYPQHSTLARLRSLAEDLAKKSLGKHLAYSQLRDLYLALYDADALAAAAKAGKSQYPALAGLARILQNLARSGRRPGGGSRPSPGTVNDLAYYLGSQAAIEAGRLWATSPAETLRSRIGGEEYVKLVRWAQDVLAQELSKRGVVVEACPASNTAIRHTGDPGDHPLHRFLERNVRLCIGSDDPSALASDIYLDLAIAEALLAAVEEDKLAEIAGCRWRRGAIAKLRPTGSRG